MDKKEIFFGILIAVFLAIIISPFASPWPDGLEKVAEDKGFLEKSEISPMLPAPIADYAWPNLSNEKLATSAAGVTGTLIVFILAYGLASLVRRRHP